MAARAATLAADRTTERTAALAAAKDGRVGSCGTGDDAMPVTALEPPTR